MSNMLFLKIGVFKPTYFISTCFICLAIALFPAGQIWGTERAYDTNEIQIPEYSGKVTNSEGEPLSAISVQRRGVAGGTFTNAEGEYNIHAKKGEVLVFSGIGYTTQEIRLVDNRTINVEMNLSAESIDEIVVVGYGTQKRSDVTNSIATVDVEEIQNAPQANVIDMLAGRVAGLTVIEEGGTPGGTDEGSEVTIRGIGTLNEASPLVVIDGVQSTLHDLSMLGVHEIEAISVLKDASSTAIYGARGANGVILVTTIAPAEGNFRFTLNSWAGFQEATVKPKFVNSWQWMTLHNEAVGGGLFPDWAIENVRNGIYTNQFSDYNPVPDVFDRALQHNHNLSVQGGTKVTNFTGSIGFLDQDGIIVNNRSDRINYRSSIAIHISPKVRLGFNFLGSRQAIHGNFGGTRAVMRRLYRTYPATPLHYANGEWGVHNSYTDATILPARLFAEIGRTDQYFNRNNFIPSVELRPIKNMVLRTQVSVKQNSQERESFHPTYTFYTAEGEPAPRAANNQVNRLNQFRSRNKQMQISQTANYDWSPNRNNRFAFLLGYEFLQNKIDRIDATGSNLPNNEQQVFDRATTDIMVRGSLSELRLQSFFGRVNYAVKNRYFLEANVRADGSSRFPPTRQYAVLPSMSAGWMISREKFFADAGLNKFFQEFKLRAGWGKTGNDRMERTQQRMDYLGGYVHQQTLNLENYYYFGGEVVPGAALASFANENISWEETATTGAGIDMIMFKKRIELTIDWYDRLTDGILYRVPLPPSFGTPGPAVQNVATVSNRGWEFTGRYRHNAKNSPINFHIGGNLSFNRNKILSLSGEETISDPFILREGEEFNSFYGHIVRGVAKTEEDKQYTLNGNGGIGNLIFEDLNNDGFINEMDRAILGSSNIPWTYGINGGFNFKGLSFNFLLQGVEGKKIFIRDWGNRPGDGAQMNFWREWWDNRYDPVENPEGSWPRMARTNVGSGTTSTFWIHNASYLRLRNVELGYTFPTAFVNRYKLTRFRVFMSGKNLLTFTDLIDQIDPERRSNEAANTAFPQTKVLTLGVNVGF